LNIGGVYMANSGLMVEPPGSDHAAGRKMPRIRSGGRGDNLKRRRPPIPQ
jgi:hypothetical protein